MKNFSSRPVSSVSLLAAAKKAAEKGHRNIGLTDSETRRFSLMSAIKAASSGDWTKAGFEREVSQAAAAFAGRDVTPGAIFVPNDILKRDLMATSGGASGGYLVGTTNAANSFVDMLRPRSVVSEAGATFMSGLQGNVAIPMQTAASSYYWLSTEATAITESNSTFGQLTLTPKTVGAYTEVSRQLQIQSSPDADAIILGDIARSLSAEMDRVALVGSGLGGQPVGIMSYAGSTGQVTGGSVNLGILLEFVTDIAQSCVDINKSTIAFFMHPDLAKLLMQRQRFTGTDTPLWEGNLMNGTVLGIRAFASPNMPAGKIICGDWSNIVIGTWGNGIEISVNPYSNFQAGITGIRGMLSCDVGIRNGMAFSIGSSML